MAQPLRVSDRVLIPAAALSWRAVRSSGPGGQNVNKVASKVELRVDLARIEGLPADALECLQRMTARRRDAEGRLLLVSQRTRDQHRNLEDARGRLRELVARALAAPRPRQATRTTASARERRLAEKKRAGSIKRSRGRVAVED